MKPSKKEESRRLLKKGDEKKLQRFTLHQTEALKNMLNSPLIFRGRKIKHRHREENRYSEIKRVLVKERYLKRYGKTLSKRVVRSIHGAVCAPLLLDSKPGHTIFRMSWPSPYIICSGSGKSTSGLSASLAMMNGGMDKAIIQNLQRKESLLRNSNNSITK